MVSDRYLEHPDVSCALRTGYPRRYQLQWDDFEEEENNCDDEEEYEWEYPS